MFDLYFAPRKGIRIPESGKVLLVGSGIREIFDTESGIQGFGIQNRAQVLRNPTKEWNPETKFH